MLVYVLVKKVSHTTEKDVEKWINKDFKDNLYYKELDTNIGVYDSFEKANEVALELINKLGRLYLESEPNKKIFSVPIRIFNSYILGSITYRYLDEYYIVNYVIDELELK